MNQFSKDLFELLEKYGYKVDTSIYVNIEMESDMLFIPVVTIKAHGVTTYSLSKDTILKKTI